MLDDDGEMTDGRRLALRFLDALSRRDFRQLEQCLAEDVWFRALLPKQLVERKTAAATVETYRSWFGEVAGFESVETDHHTMAGREFLRYRFSMLPESSPTKRHHTEQVGFCRVKDGKISRIDIVCCGLFPQ